MTSRDQQIRAVFQAALERPSNQRASFVAELCGGDAELRRSVERLLDQANGTAVDAPPATTDEEAPGLPLGSLLLHYRIDGIVARGGMGVVYRATDTKLSRPVAIKFLSAPLADAEAHRRFRQEAATASGLNHPHIVTVYDVGEHEGKQYIVSELVDGGTLDDWSRSTRRRGWRQAAELLTGIADALAAAHAAGVLHRDVKPGNILIATQGYAKLADFGLAKLVAGGARDSRSVATRAGFVVGTVAYMSPEQAAGQALDARSDVFSFGIVLYELLAGRNPFAAPTDLALLKNIAESEPAPLTEAVPEPLRAVVERALEKDPADRYQTMQDLVADLRRATRKGATQPTVLPAVHRNSAWLAWSAVSVAIVSLAAVVWVVSGDRPPAAATGRMHLTLPAPGYRPGSLGISPDGTTVAYGAVADGMHRISLQPLGTLGAPRAIPRTEEARGVFWAPDGRSIGFVAEGQLKRVDVASGAVDVVGQAYPIAIPGSWLSDDTILYTTPTSQNAAAPLGRIAAAGGPTTVLAGEGDSPKYFYALPRMLPDGEHWLFVRVDSAGDSPTELYVGAIAGGAEPQRLTTISTLNPALSGQFGNLAYADGFLLYYRNDTLVAHRFDADRLALVGTPIPLAEDVGEFAVSDNGILVWRPRTGPLAVPPPPRRLVWYDRSGQRTAQLDAPSRFRSPVLAPDARRVAMSVPRPDAPVGGIVVTDERGGTTRLTFDAAHEGSAVWSPDGTRLAFTSGREAWFVVPSRIYERAATGSGSERLLFAAASHEIVVAWDWTRDGRNILFGRASSGRPTLMDVWVLPLSGEAPYPLIQSPFQKSGARVSPDGRWIAYTTNESGRREVVVQGFPNLERGRSSVSTRGGGDPHWRGDGGELFFVGLDGAMMAATVRADGDRLEVGTPQALFALPDPIADELPDPIAGEQDFLYAVTSDGQRFLVSELVPNNDVDGPPPAPPVINVIVNWSAGLPR